MTASQWLEVLVSFSVQVLVVTLVCKLLERTIPNAADRCALWSVCFCSVLLLACAALLLPRLHLIQPWSQLRPRTLLTISSAQILVGKLLVATWSIGASISLMQWFARGQLLRRALSRCEPMSRTEAHRLFGSEFAGATAMKMPMVLISDEIDGPFCWQIHEPTIVLPRFLLESNKDDLRNVFRHELEHLKTNHPLQLFLQNVAQVVCWFHPAIWRAAARASLMREFTCDEAATSGGANTAAYLRTLLRIAEYAERVGNRSAISFVRMPSEIVLRARRLVTLVNEVPTHRCRRTRQNAAKCALVTFTLAMSLVSIPFDSLASSRSKWSPWPTWTARVAHCFGMRLRDYETYDRRSQLFEIIHDSNADSSVARSGEIRKQSDR